LGTGNMGGGRTDKITRREQIRDDLQASSAKETWWKEKQGDLSYKTRKKIGTGIYQGTEKAKKKLSLHAVLKSAGVWQGPTSWGSKCKCYIKADFKSSNGEGGVQATDGEY